MIVMATKETSGKQKSAKARLKVYGRFLQWLRFHYKINQTRQAEIMGTSQGTISNWQTGAYEASWQANVYLADHFGFDKDMRELHSILFLYGQGVDMPTDDPANMPFGLANLVLPAKPKRPHAPEETGANIEAIENLEDRWDDEDAELDKQNRDNQE